MTRLACCWIMIVALGAPCGAGERPRLTPADVTPETVRAAIERGTAFLLSSQNPDGSWGGAADSLTTWSGWTWSNPESHRAWRVATTGLCCLALLEVEPDTQRLAAVDRALDYLTANAGVRRPSEWDTMDCWANIYGLQAVAAACRHPHCATPDRQAALAAAAQEYLRQLARSEALSGGWGYLEFTEPRTTQPQWSTSFTTASGIIALIEARDAGLDVDADMLRRAVTAVRRCWLPNGAYTYAVQAVPHPGRIGSIGRVQGSLARIQSCNLALLMAGDDVTPERLQTGIDQFFRDHRFLDIATGKPIPHEAFYQNSGYFYMYGHYYAARVIALLPPNQRAAYWPQLQYEVMKMQISDGSMWDYDHHAYDKPYGTAYGLMALVRSLPDHAGNPPALSAAAQPAELAR